MLTSKQLRRGCAHADAERGLWNVRKEVGPSNQTFCYRKFALTCFVMSSPTVFCSLWQNKLVGPASLLQLSCLSLANNLSHSQTEF